MLPRGVEAGRKSRRTGVGLRSVRPYLGPDDRCRGPSLDKLSFVPGLPGLDAGASLYYSFHGFVHPSLFRPRPSASLCLRCARASSFGTRFEWTANTRAVSGGGTSNRAETGHKTKKNRSDLWCSLPAILTGSTEDSFSPTFLAN